MNSRIESKKSDQKPGEIIFACLLLVASLLVTYYAIEISGFSSMSSPGSIPMLASLFMLVSSLITVIKTFSKSPSAGKDTFVSLLTPPIFLFFVFVSLGYILVIDQLGFLLSSGLFLFTSIAVLYRQGPLLALLVSTNTLAIVYIIFRLIFKVILPEASLWE